MIDYFIDPDANEVVFLPVNEPVIDQEKIEEIKAAILGMIEEMISEQE